MPAFLSQLSVFGTREEIREQVVHAFLTELPGTGKGELTTQYTYTVESTALGEQVLLRRPAPLNKGMDFIVCASRSRFLLGRRMMFNPSHNNIYEDLLAKQRENPQNMNIILSIITDIYNCQRVDWVALPTFMSGHDIELVLKLIKWLFIEQDVTYWNWSGRNMFYTGILNFLHR
ncbi:hypothetical protein [Desulfovibrio sp.]|uniref:hypothetical protein n=1 Tax=Desulfovibrio sp. TaxID=885 RepID=UPI003D11934E